MKSNCKITSKIGTITTLLCLILLTFSSKENEQNRLLANQQEKEEASGTESWENQFFHLNLEKFNDEMMDVMDDSFEELEMIVGFGSILSEKPKTPKQTTLIMNEAKKKVKKQISQIWNLSNTDESSFSTNSDDIIYCTNNVFNIKQNYYSTFCENGEFIFWYEENNFELCFQNALQKTHSTESPPIRFPKRIRNKLETAWVEVTNEGILKTGGDLRHGGTGPSILLQDIKTILPAIQGFFALSFAGTAVAWGSQDYLGNYPFTFVHQNVSMIYGNDYAFVALLLDHSVVAWGDENKGGKIPFSTPLTNVKNIFSNQKSFLALFYDQTILAWGDEESGKIPDDIKEKLKNVKTVCAMSYGYAVLLENGNVYSWGEENFGGGIWYENEDVYQIFSTQGAVAALLKNGKILLWGNEDFGGGIVPTELQNEKTIMLFSTGSAFTSFLENGQIIVWGNKYFGGDFPDAEMYTGKIKMIFSNNGAFAILLKDGNVVTWGNEAYGGVMNNISPEMGDEFSFLQEKIEIFTIFPKPYGFIAMFIDGRTVTWGN